MRSSMMRPAAAVSEASNFVISFGNRKGQKLGDVDLKYIAWYPNEHEDGR